MAATSAAPSPSPPELRRRPREPPLRCRAGAAYTIEDQVRQSYYTPSPQAYSPYDPRSLDLSDPKRLGKISESQVPSALDHASRTKAFVPGPGSYQTSDNAGFALPEGGRLNRNAPAQRLKIDEYPVPAPGHYGVPDDPTRPRLVNGRFGRDPKIPKFIQDEQMRARHIPGPGAHDVMEAMEAAKPFCPEGGRTLAASKPPSYFDQAPRLTDENPPPDRYDVPGAIQVKTAGRLVYRYESATIAETRQLVTRIVGDGDTAPGPGTYDLPDPPPIAGAPSLRGRSLGHGMPHPFAYNCAPDLARNFGSLAPVRQQNSADQIFGNGVNKGVVARGPRRESRPSSAGRVDQVPSGQLPASLRPLDEQPEDGAVVWRSGGFTSLRKTRSASTLRGSTTAPPAEHPSVELASKSYPSLSRKGRGSSTFLPMASRRSESVSTHSSSGEHQRLRRGKWQLAAVAEGIQSATAAALEPLDLDRLRLDAARAMQDKARERMRLEGVSEAQQETVLREMAGVMEEQRRLPPGAAAAEEPPAPPAGDS